MKISAVWASPLLLLATCLAQSQQTRPVVPDGGISQRLISIFIPSLPNAPFTATVNTEWVRILPDNTRITLVNHRLIARDSAGRVFRNDVCLFLKMAGSSRLSRKPKSRIPSSSSNTSACPAHILVK